MLFLAQSRVQLQSLHRNAALFAASRGVADLAITLSGKPVISSGTGGRSSRTGRVATVFGANGFLGRYLVSKLARQGTVVMVPYREEMRKRFLKVTGDLGVVNFIEFDIRNMDSVEEAVKNSDIVFNLIGRNYETKLFNFNDVNVETTRRIAETCAKFNVERFVQVSSHDASPDSPSAFLRTKFEAEQVAREIFPLTTIVRPSPMVGQEDKVVRKIIAWPNIVVNNGAQVIRPVHVMDVAAALKKIAFDDSTAGKTFELYGPDEYSLDDIRRLCEYEGLIRYSQISVPKAPYAWLTDKLNKLIWWPIGCADEVERMTIDQTVDKSAATFADIGMAPAKLREYLGGYVRPWRGNLFQDVAPDSIQERKREREFIHITR
ncbi:hypothetical protein BZA70DRAFT_279323 [Myxozyma melibiosi]|uniref:NAD-dependent epimerase/dehydratase domain-containing protein n=1 Tax=Myxozyma melibiosi TaxID=54550 RepID=A0ABR1F5T4_9ASCO